MTIFSANFLVEDVNYCAKNLDKQLKTCKKNPPPLQAVILYTPSGGQIHPSPPSSPPRGHLPTLLMAVKFTPNKTSEGKVLE